MYATSLPQLQTGTFNDFLFMSGMHVLPHKIPVKKTFRYVVVTGQNVKKVERVCYLERDLRNVYSIKC